MGQICHPMWAAVRARSLHDGKSEVTDEFRPPGVQQLHSSDSLKPTGDRDHQRCGQRQPCPGTHLPLQTGHPHQPQLHHQEQFR